MSTAMGTPLRVAAFLLGVVAVFALALGVGRWVGPLEVEPVAHGADPHGGPETSDGHEAAHVETAGAKAVGGLTATQGGHTLRLADQRVAPGARVPVTLTIEDADGHPVTDFDVVHGKRLHLVAVRRDLTGFQHVHPTLDEATGTWAADLSLTPGAWRIYADATPTGAEAVVLGEDLLVAGRLDPAPLPQERRVDTVDGYQVTLSGATTPGEPTDLALRVERGGEPVDDLEPYLGAHGHLVVIRAGDLGYLHVHPEDGPPGPEVEFATELPTAGTYAAFLDFKHRGEVRTATFALEAGDHHEH